MFGSNVSDITQMEEMTEESLLSAPPFTLTYENNVTTELREDFISVTNTPPYSKVFGLALFQI